MLFITACGSTSDLPLFCFQPRPADKELRDLIEMYPTLYQPFVELATEAVRKVQATSPPISLPPESHPQAIKVEAVEEEQEEKQLQQMEQEDEQLQQMEQEEEQLQQMEQKEQQLQQMEQEELQVEPAPAIVEEDPQPRRKSKFFNSIFLLISLYSMTGSLTVCWHS